MSSKVQNADCAAAISMLARQVREDTLQLLNMPHPSWLTWSPPGTSNHILWHAGHAQWLQDALTIQPLTGHSELPPGWAAKFAQHSTPRATNKWPDAAEVASRLQDQLGRVLNLLNEHASMIAKRANVAPRDGGWPLVPGMIHGWHDEARHQGEMYLLYKLRRMK